MYRCPDCGGELAAGELAPDHLDCPACDRRELVLPPDVAIVGAGNTFEAQAALGLLERLTVPAPELGPGMRRSPGTARVFYSAKWL